MVRICGPSFCKAASGKLAHILRKSLAPLTRFFQGCALGSRPARACKKASQSVPQAHLCACLTLQHAAKTFVCSFQTEIRIPGYLSNRSTLLKRSLCKLLSKQSSEALLLASSRIAIWFCLANRISKHLKLEYEF